MSTGFTVFVNNNMLKDPYGFLKLLIMNVE